MITKKNRYTNLTINSTCPRCKDGKLVDKSVWRKRILRCPTCYVEYYFKLDKKIENKRKYTKKKEKWNYPPDHISAFDLFSMDEDSRRRTVEGKTPKEDKKWVDYILTEINALPFVPVTTGSLCLLCKEDRLIRGQDKHVLICPTCNVEYYFILDADLIHRRRLSHIIFSKKSRYTLLRYGGAVCVGDICPVCTNGNIEGELNTHSGYIVYCNVCNIQFEFILKAPEL